MLSLSSLKSLFYCTGNFFFIFSILVCGSIVGIVPSLTASSNVLSSTLSFRHFTEKDGLTSKTIYQSMQDKNGFIWFASDAGAFRYDGKYFKRFSTQDGLADNEVLKIYEDKTGRIWFLSLNGHLSFWNNGIIHNPDNTPFLRKAYTGSSLFSFYEDTKGRLWFGTVAAGFILIENETVTIYSPEKFKSKISSVYVHEDFQGNIWTFGLNKLINLITGDSLSLNDSKVYHTNACHIEGGKTIVYFTDEGVYSLANHTSQLLIEKNKLPSSKIIILIDGNSDLIWICTTSKGCFEFKNGILTNNFFPNSSISSVLKDREGNLWFGTLGESVYFIPSGNTSVLNLNQSSGITADNILSLALDEQKNVWLGYQNGTVDKISGFSKSSFTLSKPDQGNFCRVTSLLVTGDTTWCGTDFGIYFIYHNKIKYIPHQKNSSAYYSVKQLYKKGDDVYATCHYNVMRVKSSGRNLMATEMAVDSSFRTFAITGEGENKLVISGNQGVMECTVPGNLFSVREHDSMVSSLRILDMKMHRDQLILADGATGLHILEGRKIVQCISTLNGLSANSCRKIFVSGNSMFVATDNGLTVLQKDQDKWKVNRILTTKDGLLSNSINDVIESGNKLYVATSGGLSILDEPFFVNKKFIGQTLITEMITDSTHVSDSEHWTFEYGISRLLIRFAYPVFSPANAVNIRYRLLREGNAMTEWQNSQNNEVEFSALAPGDYLFQLRPDLSSETLAPLKNYYLKITPLWWQNIYSKIFFSLIVFCLLFIAVRKIMRRKYESQLAQFKQRAMLESERNRIATDMHDDLGADLTHIAILSEIILQEKKEEVRLMNLHKIADVSKGLIDTMGEIIWSLNSSNDTLVNLIAYLHRYTKEFLQSNNIEVVVSLPEQIPDKILSAIYRRNVLLIVKESLHNAVKYSGSKKMKFEVNCSGNDFSFRFCDFGKGFSRNGMEGRGMGLLSMQRRSEENNDRLEIQSSENTGITVIYISGKQKNVLNETNVLVQNSA
jgi:signal transduction histidine kinase/ligand-binding sensor domain-containing protein